MFIRSAGVWNTFCVWVISVKDGCCKRTSEESGTIGGRKEKELVDDDLATGKHPTI